MYLNSSEHAGGGDAEVQVGQRVGVGRFIQQRRFLLWQIIWRENKHTISCFFYRSTHLHNNTCVCDVPVSMTGGHVRTSTAAEASFDLSSLQMSCVVITHTERLTCRRNDERKRRFVLNAASSCRVSPPNKLFNKTFLWDLRQSNSDLRRRLLPGSSLFTSHSFIHLVFYTAGWFLSLNSVFSLVCSELNKICLDPFTFWGTESWKNPSFIHLNASLKVPYYKAFSTS